MSRSESELTIGEVVRATGLTEATLRAWERRYGFPTPPRGEGGQRRYRGSDIEQIGQVLEWRSRGLDLVRSIERAKRASGTRRSFFAALRLSRPELAPVTTRKTEVLRLSRAIEDESLARAERSILIGGFQRERFYRQSEARWRELSRGAAHVQVFADFEQLRSPTDSPLEVPLALDEPAAREWVVISLAPEHAAALIAWERPGRRGSDDQGREFEMLFSLRPQVVRDALGIAFSLSREAAPEAAREAVEYMDELIDPTAERQLDLSAAITARALSVL